MAAQKKVDTEATMRFDAAGTGPGDGSTALHAPIGDNLVPSPETGHEPFVSVDNPLPAAGPASGPNKE